MNQRFCTQLGHQQFEADHICTYKPCNMTRWCCSECIRDGIHGHQLPNQNHIMNQSKLSAYIKQEEYNLQEDDSQSHQSTQIKNLFSQVLKVFQKLEKSESRQNILSQLNNWIYDCDYNQKLQSLIVKLEGHDFIQLDDDDINQLLNINQYQFIYNIEQSKEKMKQHLNIILQNAKDYQENELKSRKYSTNKIYKGHEYHINTSIISNNEQYLVYNIKNILHIHDIKSDKTCKQIQQKNRISTVQFTHDTQYLFVGDILGYSYGFNVQNNFKNYFKRKIHQERITQIIIQKQYLITCSDDFTIIKTNIINKQQISKLVGHTDSIFCIDYDDLNDIIISVSDDQPIKIWDCVTQSVLFEQELTEDQTITQLQLINNKQSILSLDCYGNLFKWKIDQQKKQLVKLESYQDNSKIQRFSVLNNDQNLLLICDLYCKILNNKNEQICTIQHNLEFEYYTSSVSYRQQLDNLKNIMLQDGKYYIINKVKKYIFYKVDYTN